MTDVIAATRAWLEHAVIDLNLCPFARAVHARDQIRYIVSDARTSDALVADLIGELLTLAKAAPEDIDTTLLIHPHVLEDFADYNAFLDVADAAVETLGLTGVIQVASFHPDYRFAESAEDDVANCTNRSPYPMLHLLREASVDKAVAAFPDAAQIYERNIETMKALGHSGWRALAARIREAGGKK